MRRRGLFRLWVVATIIFVPAVAFWQINDSINTWRALDDASIHMCVDQEGSPGFNVDTCIHKAGADQTAFQHEHTTPRAYWGEALAVAFVFDLIITALLIGAFFVARWVVRGFRAEPS